MNATTKRLYYPCIFYCKTASISKRVSMKPMTRDEAEAFLKEHYWAQWVKGDAIPQPVDHHYFKAIRGGR